jgi:hypothetical protein
MYAQQEPYVVAGATERPAWLAGSTEASRRAGRRLRRSAHRHTRLTIGDHVAFWRAQHDGMRCTRSASALGWPGYLWLAVLLVSVTAVGVLTGLLLV